MKENSSTHMLEKPYIREVLNELQQMGHEGDKAKQILIRFYRPVRRTWGFEPNARDFAREIEELSRAVLKKYNPLDPD